MSVFDNPKELDDLLDYWRTLKPSWNEVLAVEIIEHFRNRSVPTGLSEWHSTCADTQRELSRFWKEKGVDALADYYAKSAEKHSKTASALMCRYSPGMIVAAAIRNSDGAVIVGARHFDQVMTRQIAFYNAVGKWKHAEQGFIDSRGEFLTREEALARARETGQIVRRCGGDEKELFSENLY